MTDKPTPQQYPLQWPPFIPRASKRDSYQNVPALNTAIGNVTTSLRLFGRDSGKQVSNVVISSNVTLGHEKPGDPGIAVWFLWEDEWRCIASDRFTSVAGNVQAIHKILEARRQETKYGSLHMIRAAFQGYLALPGGSVVDWRKVFGITGQATLEDVELVYRRLAEENHPDKGGDVDRMAEINAARAAARAELKP